MTTDDITTNKNEVENFFFLSSINSKEENKLKVSAAILSKAHYLKGLYDDFYSAVENDSKIIPCFYVNSGDKESLMFVVKYLNTYANIDEIDPPEQPMVDNMDIMDIFESEVNIFGESLDISKVEESLPLITNVLKIAEELKLEKLYKKTNALLWFYSTCFLKSLN